MRSATMLQPRPVPSSGARHPRVLMVCALLSALGHAVLLLKGTADGSSSMASQAPERYAVSTVRLLAVPATPENSIEPTAPDDLAVAIAATAEPAAPESIARAEISDGKSAGNGDHNSNQTNDGDSDDRYLSRSQLDQPPAAQADIALPFPDTAPLGSYRAVLTLFIDPTGQVQRVRTESAEGTESTEGASLPPSLDNAARQAFLAARFTPGVKDGQPVRSRIRVEVLYSTELLVQRSASAGVAGGESAP